MSDMTRKDAIRRLERLLRCGDGTYEFKVEINTDDQKAIQLDVDSMKVDEAYQLEYELTTKNDTPKYCDRSICLKNEYNNVGCEDCEVTKSQEPPVTPQEPKTGHWIDADGDNAICGCCNRLNHLYGDYCKHCGAKMIEPQKCEGKE